MALSLVNTLTRRKELFKPLRSSQVTVYNCGPTVYDFPTVGNWRAFVFDDILKRTLQYSGYQVKQVMNLTDVGHMTMTEEQKLQTGPSDITDNELGEDRLEKTARKTGKTVWEVAQFYIDDFVAGLVVLNCELPDVMPRATDHIAQQIAMIQQLETKGYTYITKQAVYFDTAKFARYGELSGQKLEDKLVGAREDVHVDPDKHHPADFRLWQINQPNHAMEWESPWGKGFPGWHIECSAMSTAYLGAPFDIHTGGVDHIAVHHENEIAQTEAALGVPMCRVWLHNEFLQIDGGRMGKSLGNAYTLQDIIQKGFNPLALRYFYLNAHYRSKQNFTWEALGGAAVAFKKLRKITAELMASTMPATVLPVYADRFVTAIEDDLNLPQALSVVWDLSKDGQVDAGAKLATLLDFDRVLGLQLDKGEIPDAQVTSSTGEQTAIEALVQERVEARRNKDFRRSDELRDQLFKEFGVVVEDTATGPKWVRKS